MMSFFENSEAYSLDLLILRPLSHIYGNWDVMWDDAKYEYLEEEDSCAKDLNLLIKELGSVNPPSKYHDNEDRLAEYVIENLGWDLKKVSGKWEGSDYESILEQGGFHDKDEQNLVLAAAGRIMAAKSRGQGHFDEMEKGHKKILSTVLSIILYHRITQRPYENGFSPNTT